MDSVYRQTGHRDERLDSVKPPADCLYLFALWVDIRRGVEMGAGGLHITWEDLKAYQEVNGVDFDAFDVEAIMAMEDAVTEVTSDRMKKAGADAGH